MELHRTRGGRSIKTGVEVRSLDCATMHLPPSTRLLATIPIVPMLSIGLVVALLMCTGGCASDRAKSASNTSARLGAADVGSVEGLIGHLRTIVKCDQADYEMMLRNLDFVCSSVCSNKDWTAVRESLERQGMVFEQVPGMWANFPASSICTVQSAAYTTPSGISHDLRMRFVPIGPWNKSTMERDKEPLAVGSVHTTLIARVDRPLQDLLESHTYPLGTVMDKCLRSKECRELCSRYQVVEELRVGYGPWQAISPEMAEVGFFIDVECASGARTGGHRSYFMASRMDPAPRWGELDKWTRPSRDFVPSRELGDVMEMGGNDRGPSTP
jgi:hypothetical protein